VSQRPLITREQYQGEFTFESPSYESFGNQEYVPDPSFGSKLPARVRVDGRLTGTARISAKGLIALSTADLYRLLEAVKHARELEVEYAIGYSQPLSFGLTGLPDMLSKLAMSSVSQLPGPPKKPPLEESDDVALLTLLLDVGNNKSFGGILVSNALAVSPTS
jgi:hypothetical protein